MTDIQKDKTNPSFQRKIACKMANLPVIGKACKPRKKVAVIRLSGVISDQGRRGNISYNRYAPLIEKAFGMNDIEEVALVINSPGGAPAQCSLISTMIRALSKEKDISVSAYVEDVAASGGYWLACAADKIYVQPSSIVGSVGVIAAMFGFDKAIERYDIERRVYTAGEQKAFLDPFQPEDKNAVKRIKLMQGDIHRQFIGWVKERRGDRLKGEDKTLFEGQVFTGNDGMNNGLVDAIGDVWSVMRGKYGEKVKLISIEPDKSFIQGLIGSVTKFPNAEDILTALEHKIIWNRWGL
jgi:signal peptide peptidase SppA